MRLNINESEKESTIRSVTESIEELKEKQDIDEFGHLANLLYVYQKLTGKNLEEVNNEDENV